jgi:RNA polymerase sigma-70 factor (ECF subfamily)
LADDLLQESYLRFVRAGFEGEGDAHRKNYLFRIATNLVRDHFRRRRPEVELVPERDAVAHHEPASHLRSDVGRALAELSANDRQMLWLAYAEGASHREIASVLGLRTASIRSMLFRARRRLVEKLTEGGLVPGGGTP